MEQQTLRQKTSVQLDDLTMFDYQIDEKDLRDMQCTKALYFISLSMSILINTMMVADMAEDEFEVFPFIGCFICFVSYFFSVSYVYFPKAKITRMKITKIILFSFCVCIGIYAVMSIIIEFIYVFFTGEENKKDGEGVWKYYFAILFLLLVVPIFHCIMIAIIWRQRLRIAWKIEDEMNNIDVESLLITQINNEEN